MKKNIKEYDIDEMKDYIIHYKDNNFKEHSYKIYSSSPENARLRFLDKFRGGVTSASIKDIYEVGS